MTADPQPAAEPTAGGKRRALALLPAWLAYAVSMVLPVLPSGGNLVAGMRGWQAFRVSFEAPFLLLTGRESFAWHDADVLLYFVPNVVMLASPLLVLRPALRRRRRLVLGACAAAILAACLPLRNAAELRLGYWTWLASMGLLAAAGALSRNIVKDLEDKPQVI